MSAPALSPDARQVLLALRALEAATSGAIAVAAGLSLQHAAAALDELAAAGEARCTPEGTWLVARRGPARGKGPQA
jgi:hypothetical protein